jgi:iron complex outermembrane receptor protein
VERLSIHVSIVSLSLLFLLPAGFGAAAQGILTGTVTMPTDTPAHRATVMIVQLGRITETDANGSYRFENVPAGTYDLLAYQPPLDSEPLAVEVIAGESRAADLRLRISPVRAEITVTATGREQTAFEAVQSVTSLDAFDLSERMATSIGEILDGESGIARRSFGPGSSRPVIRGFDGDRVLIMQDGVGIGSLASQSGDHGEPIDAGNVERIEVLKGPATLLYGSNAVGGVVNAISSHQEVHGEPHQGVRGQVSSSFGSGNSQAGGSFNTEIGIGNWMFWAGGGGQRTSDYRSPAGDIGNSASRVSNGSLGFGWFGERGFASIDYKGNDGRYGIPFAGEFHGHHEDEEGDDPEHEEELEAVDIAFRRHGVRFTGGFRSPGAWLEGFELSLNYSDWNHDEVEQFHDGVQAIGTTFENQQFAWRGAFTQGPRGPIGGSFGFQGMVRSYEALGEESLSPPVDQQSFAVFVLEQLDFEQVQLQLGGRIEHSAFEPIGLVERAGHDGGEPELVDLPDRSFTGASGGIAARVDLWPDGAFVANFTSSFRSPALEELYNFGPHVGNLAFEVGDHTLGRERSNGIDLSLRHRGERVRGEANFFYYGFEDFVYLAPTEEVVDGLVEADYAEDDARFLGGELSLDVAIHDESLWLNLGMDAVDAELTATRTSLPRIPPMRGRLGLDYRHGGLSVRPELVVADRREDIFETETPTAGYAVLNLAASYTIPQAHFSHHLSVNVFNAADRLYRNHLSFIKELAPEIGRGVRVAYTVKFF